MLTRFHKILIGLLVVQIGLAVYTSSRGEHAAPAREKPLLVGYDAGAVTRLQVQASGGGAPIDLVKRDAGWVLASQFDYPADATKVSDALGALGRMAAAEPIATRAGRHHQLEVDDATFQRKLIVTAGGKDRTVYLGGPAGARRIAVRTDGDRVYAVAGLSTYTFGADARSWIDPAYVKIAKDDVARLTVTRGAGKLEVARAPAPPAPAANPGEPPPPPPPATWTVTLDGAPIALATGETLDTAAIDTLLDRATNVQLSAPADPARPAPTPTATITIERNASGTTTPAPTVIDVVADGDGYWVHERGAARAARVDEANLDGVLTATRATFVKAPAPPTPPPAPGAPSDQPLTLPPPGP